jgi:hypothetical protein
MNSITPPVYGYRAVCGISPKVDEWITGQAPDSYLISCAKTSLLTNKAAIYKSKLTPLAETRDALKQVFLSCGRGKSNSEWLRGMALMRIPGAIMHDLVKPPYYVARMAIASSRSKYEREKVENEVVDEILESLSVSLEAVMKMVIILGLGTPEALHRQVRGGRFLPVSAHQSHVVYLQH